MVPDRDRVIQIMREVAACEIMPRFRRRGPWMSSTPTSIQRDSTTTGGFTDGSRSTWPSWHQPASSGRRPLSSSSSSFRHGWTRRTPAHLLMLT